MAPARFPYHYDPRPGALAAQEAGTRQAPVGGVRSACGVYIGIAWLTADIDGVDCASCRRSRVYQEAREARSAAGLADIAQTVATLRARREARLDIRHTFETPGPTRASEVFHETLADLAQRERDARNGDRQQDQADR